MKNRTIVVMPAYNESGVIGDLIREIRRLGHMVVVVDDASTDATVSEAKDAGARVLEMPIHLGAWPAMQAGLRLALRNGSRTVVTMDADGQHLPSSIANLCAGLESADVAIGSCPERVSRLRHLAWRLFRLITALPVRDVTSGFRAYNREAARHLLSAPGTLLDYQDMGVLLLLHGAGLRIHEVDVPMRRRLSGKSHLFSTWSEVWKYMAGTLLLCCAKRPLRGDRAC